MVDASKLGIFSVVLGIYIIVVTLSLFGLSRIKDRLTSATLSGIVCFTLLILPISFGVATTLVATVSFGGPLIDSVRAIAIVIVEAGVSAFYSFSLYSRRMLSIVMSSILIVIAITGTTFLLFL